MNASNFASLEPVARQGGTLTTPQPYKTAGFDSPQGRGVRLTPRELEVLALLCEGLPNKLIGRRLDISSATVKCHISRILSALGVASRLQAVVAAARCGLVPESGVPGPDERLLPLRQAPRPVLQGSPRPGATEASL
jgi:DNA-binding CsgD family transcriptional regulator